MLPSSLRGQFSVDQSLRIQKARRVNNNQCGKAMICGSATPCIGARHGVEYVRLQIYRLEPAAAGAPAASSGE